jgi:hypothetical protein
MNDYVYDDILSGCLKRATAQVAATTPLNAGIARSIARRPNAARLPSAPRRFRRSRIMIAIALVVGVVFAAGTAYAGITLLQSVTESDAGAAAVHQQNLGEALNLSQTRGGVTLTLTRAYADINRVLITYQVQPASPGSIFAGFATTNDQPAVTDSRGQVLAGYDSFFQTDPHTNESVGIAVYDAEIAANNVQALSLRVTVPGLHMSERSGDPPGSTFRAPDGEEVVTFNDTVFGRHGGFVLTIDSIGVGKRIAGPWIFRFAVR